MQFSKKIFGDSDKKAYFCSNKSHHASQRCVPRWDFAFYMGIWTTPTNIQGYPRYWDFSPNQDDSSVLNGIWDILLLCAHCGYSHKIIAIFPMYEFGVMAYDVAIISCIVAALERYMSHPWLIEKIQILVWHKHLHCSLIDDLTISLWHGFHSRNILWCVAAWCWNNTHVKCWWYLLVDTDIQRKAERAGKVKRNFPSAWLQHPDACASFEWWAYLLQGEGCQPYYSDRFVW